MNKLLQIMELENIEFYKELQNMDISEILEKFEKNISDEDTVFLSKYFMKDIDINTIKSMISDTKIEAKEIEAGKSKENFITSNITNGNSLFKFMVIQKKFVNLGLLKERKRTNDFISDRKEAEKYGFYNENDFKKGGKYENMKSPKQTEQQVKEWTELAFPKINGHMLENKFDLMVLINSLKQ